MFLLSSDICIYEKMKDIASTQIIKINLQILMCERKSLPFSFVANVIFPNMRFCIFVAFLENWIFSQCLKVEQKVSFSEMPKIQQKFTYLTSEASSIVEFEFLWEKERFE